MSAKWTKPGVTRARLWILTVVAGALFWAVPASAADDVASPSEEETAAESSQSPVESDASPAATLCGLEGALISARDVAKTTLERTRAAAKAMEDELENLGAEYDSCAIDCEPKRRDRLLDNARLLDGELVAMREIETQFVGEIERLDALISQVTEARASTGCDR